MATITVKTELDFSDLQHQCWSGAIDTLKTIEEHNKGDEFMSLLNELFADDDNCSLTTINDFLWFDDEYIFECLDISDEEEDDDEEEDEDWEEEEDEEIGLPYDEENCIPFC